MFAVQSLMSNWRQQTGAGNSRTPTTITTTRDKLIFCKNEFFFFTRANYFFFFFFAVSLTALTLLFSEGKRLGPSNSTYGNPCRTDDRSASCPFGPSAPPEVSTILASGGPWLLSGAASPSLAPEPSPGRQCLRLGLWKLRELALIEFG
jgi:hypothetical protein